MEYFTQIKSSLGKQGVTLVAVSKTKTPEEILNVYNQGQRIFGENRVQELLEKQPLLPSDIQWHMIGHLQTNKVKYLAPFVDMIHAVDSLKLLRRIEREAANQQRCIDVLMQVKIATEASKFGFTPQELIVVGQELSSVSLSHVRICGVMGMASFVDDTDQVRSEFRMLKQIFDSLRTSHFTQTPQFNTISMGMSGDYKLAIEEGSTMVRIGSLIFGARG